jgi:hypothetical protein
VRNISVVFAVCHLPYQLIYRSCSAFFIDHCEHLAKAGTAETQALDVIFEFIVLLLENRGKKKQTRWQLIASQKIGITEER